MGKVYRRKKRSCSLCKPQKTGHVPADTERQIMERREAEKVMADEGYWESDKVWVEPVPGTGPMATFEAWAVRIKDGRLCHYVDGTIFLGSEYEANQLVEKKRDDDIPARAERVKVLVVTPD